MRTIRIFILLSISAFFFNVTTAQVVEHGNVLIDAYFGWPNLWTNTAKTILTDANSVNVIVGSMGPLGARVEYLVSDKVGMGVEMNYASTSVKWVSNTQDDNGNNITYNYKVTIPRMRILFNFNMHFGLSDKFDGYWKLGAGYSSLKWTYETNDPNYGDDDISFKLVPFAIRIGIGGRYFITNNLHLNVELGVGGGSLMAFGLGTKF